MSDGFQIRICGGPPDPELPTEHSEKCPHCGEPPEMNYGLAGGGIGVYAFCCGRVLSKVQDLDEEIDRAMDERERGGR